MPFTGEGGAGAVAQQSLEAGAIIAALSPETSRLIQMIAPSSIQKPGGPKKGPAQGRAS